ncbi:MAG: hypothetical protein LBQ18_03495 [Campylobacteraceae bacterium]|jgi:hypothetical protein|nr:hypothetical protein [Campylobacteraceae bacterium]
MKKMFITLVMALAFVGCGGGDSSSNKEQPAEKSEGIPELDRTDSIVGIDENANGVRDDIEAYINKNYSDEGQRKALFQYAKATQATLLVNASDIIAVKNANGQRSRGLHCISLKFNAEKGDENPGIAWEKIRSMTTNTKTRLKAYLNFSKALEGTSWALPKGDTCE